MIKIELEKEFAGSGEVNEFNFSQFRVTEHVNSYKITSDNINYHFEVFTRLFSPVCIDFENRVYSLTDFKEIYPKSNEFGKRAFTFRNEKDAIKKFNELEKLANEKIKSNEDEKRAR
jgi:hypothetical protein